ncbi:MAG: hypothetical protein HOJ90_00220 [Alphaproteobacteria bacterium]|nr:hypothetical protein [Alphaproteobacteria bacterium]
MRQKSALVLTAALAVAMVSFAANSAYAQVINLLFEDRAADVKIGEEFEALNDPFEIRWSATGGKITVRLLGPDGQPKIAGDPQSRLDDEPPHDRQNVLRRTGQIQDRG